MMMSNQKQLFRLLRNVDISHEARYDAIRKTYVPTKLIARATFAVLWPDGTPCSLAENYLLAKFKQGASVQDDGGSLRTIVTKLTHLIRHCWVTQRDFWELTNDDLDSLIQNLMRETRPGAPLEKARDNNTIRAIISSAVDFLLWIQNELLIDNKLIGKGRKFSISLIEKRVVDARGDQRGTHLIYCRLPPPETKEPKRPMSREKRNALWQAISDLSTGEYKFPVRIQKVFDSDELRAYMKARRELLLELLEATGARPAELAALSVSSNENCFREEQLQIITLKRRREAERKIKLQPSVAMKLTIFIRKHRANLLKKLTNAQCALAPNDRVFVSVDGREMSARALTTEFSMLSKEAGLDSYQSCMSMFRHRFITKQIAIHLGIYLDQNNKCKELMTDGDYRTVLKKVATITGHGSELSLLHYLDLAWEELGVYDRVNTALRIDAAVESTMTKVVSLIGDLKLARKKPSMQVLESTIAVLEDLKNEIRSTFNR